jgi:hypothetical protein
MRLRIALVTAALAVGVASPAAAETPTSPDNKPTPLEGVENGRVPADRLITVIPGCRVAREAGPSLALLFRQAASLNVGLTGRSCYRPVDDQVAVSSYNKSTGGPCAATPSTYPDGRVKGTSNHGWGKAVDFGNAGGALTFTSAGYRFLKDHANRVGWNHPGWAGPGMACAEPWHWEWVGDGGTQGKESIRADVISLLPSADELGYSTVTGLGDVIPKGTARSFGSARTVPLNWVIVGAANTPDRNGYWLLGADGGIFNYGNARFHGSTGDLRLNRPVVTMAPSPNGGGYWLAAGDGGMFTFGNAVFHGSTGDIRLNSPVVGMTPTADGGGYWLVAADGGIFSFGNARFRGSTGDMRLNSPIVGMAATPTGNGYWLVAADGGIFNFGDAAFHGSAADQGLALPAVGMVRTAAGDGYWIVAADGRVVAKGRAATL